MTEFQVKQDINYDADNLLSFFGNKKTYPVFMTPEVRQYL